jgi:hypothetical protein
MLAFLSCTLDPRFAEALAPVASSPLLMFAGWLLWTAQKAWRGKEIVAALQGGRGATLKVLVWGLPSAVRTSLAIALICTWVFVTYFYKGGG